MNTWCELTRWPKSMAYLALLVLQGRLFPHHLPWVFETMGGFGPCLEIAHRSDQIYTVFKGSDTLAPLFIVRPGWTALSSVCYWPKYPWTRQSSVCFISSPRKVYDDKDCVIVFATSTLHRSLKMDLAGRWSHQMLFTDGEALAHIKFSLCSRPIWGLCQLALTSQLEMESNNSSHKKAWAQLK